MAVTQEKRSNISVTSFFEIVQNLIEPMVLSDEALAPGDEFYGDPLGTLFGWPSHGFQMTVAACGSFDEATMIHAALIGEREELMFSDGTQMPVGAGFLKTLSWRLGEARASVAILMECLLYLRAVKTTDTANASDPWAQVDFAMARFRRTVGYVVSKNSNTGTSKGVAHDWGDDIGRWERARASVAMYRLVSLLCAQANLPVIATEGPTLKAGNDGAMLPMPTRWIQDPRWSEYLAPAAISKWDAGVLEDEIDRLNCWLSERKTKTVQWTDERVFSQELFGLLWSRLRESTQPDLPRSFDVIDSEQRFSAQPQDGINSGFKKVCSTPTNGMLFMQALRIDYSMMQHVAATVTGFVETNVGKKIHFEAPQDGSKPDSRWTAATQAARLAFAKADRRSSGAHDGRFFDNEAQQIQPFQCELEPDITGQFWIRNVPTADLTGQTWSWSEVPVFFHESTEADNVLYLGSVDEVESVSDSSAAVAISVCAPDKSLMFAPWHTQLDPDRVEMSAFLVFDGASANSLKPLALAVRMHISD